MEGRGAAGGSGLVVVLDTNVWLDLLVFGDARCGGLLRAIDGGAVRAVADAVTRDEWLRVLAYPALGLGEAARGELRSRYDGLARIEPAGPLPSDLPALPRCADPDDQVFLELALRCGAQLLLTRDEALLSLDGRVRRRHGFGIAAPNEDPFIQLVG